MLPSLLPNIFNVEVAEVSERITSSIHNQHFVFEDIVKLRVHRWVGHIFLFLNNQWPHRSAERAGPPRRIIHHVCDGKITARFAVDGGRRGGRVQLRQQLIHGAEEDAAGFQTGQRGLQMSGVGAAGLRAAQPVELAVRIAVVAQRQHRNTRQQRLVRAAGDRIAQGAVQQIRGLRIIEKR